MSLKDQMQRDVDSVFFNIDEFAEPHLINGRSVNIIIDNDQLTVRSKKEYDGISVGEILYYVKASDLSHRPEQGESQIFDKKPMVVFDCREDLGVYEIILTQNRGA